MVALAFGVNILNADAPYPGQDTAGQLEVHLVPRRTAHRQLSVTPCKGQQSYAVETAAKNLLRRFFGESTDFLNTVQDFCITASARKSHLEQRPGCFRLKPPQANCFVRHSELLGDHAIGLSPVNAALIKLALSRHAPSKPINRKPFTQIGMREAQIINSKPVFQGNLHS